ncbi:MAG TPA: M20 family metallopeptidase [Candidatus Latescibacteria bacterium]|jgi:amidohydrolase|nr:M20 family metallopeptidase [Candidatus Latescibacterota bacterium]HJP29166.1 M20 family metallopeptidase [Candidatus Latescibacterota bacterium]
MRDLKSLIDPLLPELVELRHELHRCPELAYEEHETARRIVTHLKSVPGIDLRTGVAGTGVVAILGSKKGGPCVALRADMDALPMEELGDHAHRSTVAGKMHACGHDGHVTCLVGAARVLASLGDELDGPVKFLFQPAEEGGAGGRRMCEEGVLDDPPVSAIFGLHAWPELAQGEIGVRQGGFLASADRLRITVGGVGAHAAYPHQGIDTVLVASHIIVALQSIAARNTDPLDSVVVTITQIHGGTADNIIPGEVKLSGTVRTLNSETRRLTLERIERVAVDTARAYGAAAEVMVDEGYPVLENDPAATEYVRRVAAVTDRVAAVEIPPVMGGEDFAFYAQRVPASFFSLGIRPPGRETYPKLHQPDYDFHDDAIRLGVAMHVEIARRFWQEGPEKR